MGQWIKEYGTDRGRLLNNNSLVPTWCSYDDKRLKIFSVLRDGSVDKVDLSKYEMTVLKETIDILLGESKNGSE